MSEINLGSRNHLVTVAKEKNDAVITCTCGWGMTIPGEFANNPIQSARQSVLTHRIAVIEADLNIVFNLEIIT